MANATFSKKRVLEMVENTLVYIASKREAKWEQAYEEARKPRHVGMGFYRMTSFNEAEAYANRRVSRNLYANQESRITALKQLVEKSTGDIQLTTRDLQDLVTD